MIHIERPTDPPDIPVYKRKTRQSKVTGKKVTAAEGETEDAIAFFSDPNNYDLEENKKLTEESFKFAVYKNKLLRQKLESLFHFKCAYCESVFVHVSPTDIEHYRPKSTIDTGRGTLVPGYYWLAVDWHNLLIACFYCNRTGRHETPNLPPDHTTNLGKLDHFPLSNPAGRVRLHTHDVADEEPYRLLLNPCLDHPEEHLFFLEDGTVQARLLPGGGASTKGQRSIEIYGLHRKTLNEAREKHAKDLITDLENLKDSAYNYKRAVQDEDQEAVERNLRGLDRNAEKLRSYLTAKAPFLALVRQIIENWEQQSRFEELKELGIDLAEMIRSSIV